MPERITKREVIEAIETIAKEDQEPTVRAVRAQLGRGSNSDITPVLRDWKMNQKAAEDLPDQVLSAAEEASARIWAYAKEAAENRFVGERIKLHAALEELQEEVKERDVEIDTLTEDAEAQAKDHSAKLDEITKAHAATVSDLRNQIKDAKNDAREAREDSRQLTAETKALNQQILKLTEELATARAEKAAATKE